MIETETRQEAVDQYVVIAPNGNLVRTNDPKNSKTAEWTTDDPKLAYSTQELDQAKATARRYTTAFLECGADPSGPLFKVAHRLVLVNYPPFVEVRNV